VRATGLATAVALTLMVGSVGVAAADEAPSRRDVREARSAVRDQERSVATVQAELVLANERLRASAVEAAQAAEAWNGARYRLQQAREAAAAAARQSEVATADVDRQQQAYAEALTTSYELAPELTGLSAIADADGIESVIDRATTMQNAQTALDGQYDAFRAAATLAEVATDQAEQARQAAADRQQEARDARDAARAAAAAAQQEATAVAQEKDALIAELARLQDISVSLAERRQAALEEAAAAAAAQAAQAAQEQAEQQAQQEQQGPAQQQAPQQASSGGGGGGGGESQQPTPQPAPQPAPQPTPQPAPPAPAGGASAAVAFARDQIGEPYRWGAAGPDAWDCSGLTMGAWSAGGRSLPHYSVAQYEQSTPISAAQLQPGDLVFWGSSSSPSSIYHVALYAGGGQIIHAPRTGRPVTEESMYYWTTPNFYARP
jgi:cell wall-associated NlpC family hydrolase